MTDTIATLTARIDTLSAAIAALWPSIVMDRATDAECDAYDAMSAEAAALVARRYALAESILSGESADA